MKRLICIAGCILLANYCFAQTTYYSSNTGSGGDWDLAASWTLSSDGSGAAAGPPTRTDDIVILNGHTITVDADDDNGSTGTSASTQYTVGAFTGNGTNRFYQNGLITINAGGTLSITDNNGAMLEDTIYVFGTLRATAGGNSDDLINAGYMHVYAGATLDVGDDLILIANSETILDDVALSSDDIYMDGTNALICGDGSLDIGGAIQEFNGADANAQVCSTFTINCTDGDCCDDGTTVASCAGNGDDGSFGGGGGFVLPVELTSYTADKEGRSIVLEWSTASELNNDFFTIEKSVEGDIFHFLERVPGNGTTSEANNYRFADSNITSKINYYRLSQTDFDGTTEVLGIRRVSSDLFDLEDAIFYPNPATTKISANISHDLIKSIEFVDLSGKRVSFHTVGQQAEIDVSNLPSGLYMIRWVDLDNVPHNQRLVIR